IPQQLTPPSFDRSWCRLQLQMRLFVSSFSKPQVHRRLKARGQKIVAPLGLHGSRVTLYAELKVRTAGISVTTMQTETVPPVLPLGRLKRHWRNIDNRCLSPQCRSGNG